MLNPPVCTEVLYIVIKLISNCQKLKKLRAKVFQLHCGT